MLHQDRRILEHLAEVKEIICFGILDFTDCCVAVAAVCMTSLTSWAFCCEQNRIQTASWNWIRRLSSQLFMQLVWFSFRCDRKQGRNKCRHWPGHDLSSREWTRITVNPGLIHGTGGRWWCDQSESKAMKAEEGIRWAQMAFYDKNCCSLEAVRTNWNRSWIVTSVNEW